MENLRCVGLDQYTQVDLDFCGDGTLENLMVEEAWETIENFAQGQKEWDNPPNIISELEIENLKVHAKRSFGNEIVWVEMHRNIAWEKVENLNHLKKPRGLEVNILSEKLRSLRKFHWMILRGRFNQLSHVSSPLLSKPGEYYFSFGRHLDELHVTWAHLEKKRTRLRTNTKTLKDLCSQSLETTSQAIHDAVITHQVMASHHFMAVSARIDSKADLEDSSYEGVMTKTRPFREETDEITNQNQDS
ncbi:hypothetical protein Tco_0227601 [Tanacetum coccineum]